MDQIDTLLHRSMMAFSKRVSTLFIFRQCQLAFNRNVLFWTLQRHLNQILSHHTHLATMASENKKDGETTKNVKKRSLEEMQNNDDDSDDCDLQPPSNKKRKLNTAESTQTESKQDNDEDDDLKQETNTSSKSKSASIEKADQFKICCFNLNGVRAAAKHGLEDYIQKGMQS